MSKPNRVQDLGARIGDWKFWGGIGAFTPAFSDHRPMHFAHLPISHPGHIAAKPDKADGMDTAAMPMTRLKPTISPRYCSSATELNICPLENARHFQFYQSMASLVSVRMLSSWPVSDRLGLSNSDRNSSLDQLAGSNSSACSLT